MEQTQKFHDDLQAFMQWLTDSEKTLDSQPPPSVVMEILEKQLEKQKVIGVSISSFQWEHRTFITHC